jgi:hypothetical protein
MTPEMQSRIHRSRDRIFANSALGKSRADNKRQNKTQRKGETKMKTNETNNNEFNLVEDAWIGAAEMESIAAHLPVRSNVRAGAAAVCCRAHENCN